MPRYKIINKHVYMASIVPTVMGYTSEGTPIIVDQPGPVNRVDVGTVVDSVPPDMLASAPDRFELVEDAVMQSETPSDVSPLAAASPSVPAEPTGMLDPDRPFAEDADVVVEPEPEEDQPHAPRHRRGH
jgi:hypothetical protein